LTSTAKALVERASPEAIEAVRNAIRWYVSHWYETADKGDATAKPDSPAMAVCDAATLVPELLSEIERLQGLAREACELASGTREIGLDGAAYHLRIAAIRAQVERSGK
jgi:hypothetical protein